MSAVVMRLSRFMVPMRVRKTSRLPTAPSSAEGAGQRGRGLSSPHRFGFPAGPVRNAFPELRPRRSGRFGAER